MIQLLTRRLVNELKHEYQIHFFDEENLSLCLDDIYAKNNGKFVFIIDERDCIFREYKNNIEN